MTKAFCPLLLCALILPAAALTIIPDPEGERKARILEQYHNTCISHLQKVTDRKSADKAARAIAELNRKSRYDSRDLTDGHAEHQRLTRQLSEQYFHGSAALAKALGSPENDALLPSPIAPETADAMETAARERAARREDISGGGGFTQESAWVIDISDTRQAHMAASAMAFDAVGGRCISHRKVLTDTRRFMVFTLTLIRGGSKYIVEQWCDTTATGKVYSPAKREKARQEICEKAHELHELLLSICDEDTADDFGGDVLELCEDIEELDRICEADETVLNHMYNTLSMPARERTAFALMYLHQACGHDDADLWKALRRYLSISVAH